MPQTIAQIARQKYSKNRQAHKTDGVKISARVRIQSLSSDDGRKHHQTHFNVIPIQISQFMVVVFYAFNWVLDVGGVGLLGRINLRWRCLCDAVPTETDGLSLVQQRRMVLILIHHLVEAEDGGQVDDLLLGRIGECLLVFVAQVDCDLFLGSLHASLLRRWNPFLSAHCSSHEGLEVGNIGRFNRLLVDVLDQFLAVEGSGRWFCTFVAGTLVWWQEWVLQREQKLHRSRIISLWNGAVFLHRDRPLSLKSRSLPLTIALGVCPHQCHRIHSDLFHKVWLVLSWS